MPFAGQIKIYSPLTLAGGAKPMGSTESGGDIPEGYVQWFINGEPLLMNGEIVISKEDN